jgi:hypothetical protein
VVEKERKNGPIRGPFYGFGIMSSIVSVFARRPEPTAARALTDARRTARYG